MRNAKEEFVKKVVPRGKVKCAVIQCHGTQVTLEPDYSKEEFGEFIDALSHIDYHEGYGGQELFGLVWMADGTWFTRGEYDGSEWWEYHKCPSLPKDWNDDRELSAMISNCPFC